jgi:hypothetical protein
MTRVHSGVKNASIPGETEAAGRADRHPLPTREQIEAITDIEGLRQVRDDVFARKSSIETQLEFADGDEDWERRAMGALTAHRICIGHLDKRIHRLVKGPGTATPKPDPEKKARKHQAHAARLLAEAEAKDSRVMLQREKTRTEIARALEATKVSAAMQQAMREVLDNDAYSRVMMRTWEIHESRVTKIVEAT